MNYYDARQVKPDSDREDAAKWRYTQMNDGAIWPVGYCRECPGHDTREEAFAHQREYELDNARFHESDQDVDSALQRFECEAKVGEKFIPGRSSDSDPLTEHQRCGTLTLSGADIGPGMRKRIFLCAEHMNRDGLAAAYDGPGIVASS